MYDIILLKQEAHGPHLSHEKHTSQIKTIMISARWFKIANILP